MRRFLSVLALVALLAVAQPVFPGHGDGAGSVQWNFACATNQPTSPGLSVTQTVNVGSSPGELALSGDRLLVSGWSNGGFRIYSLANPVNPVHIGTSSTSGTTLDMKASTDGNTVFVGNVGRIRVVDISNPASPTTVRSVNLPGAVDQGHMLYVAPINGKDHLFAASQSGSGVYIFEVTGAPSSRNLVMLTQFAPGSPLGAHDMFVQHDPVLNKPILYIANGFMGWIAADVSDPALPIPLAIVPNPDAGQSYVHSVQSQWIEGRRLVATISELGGNLLRVWDATVIHAPVLLGSWSSQTDLGVVPSASSQHNIQIVDGRLYVAHYRCGFYVFDLTALPDLPVFTPLQPIAHFAPVDNDGQHWDVVLRNGHIYTSDMRMGNGGRFYVVAYNALTAGDPTQTSTG